ncbi:hypothetical protein F4679DRAFT_522252 [Xylaria curta]|nr:hypothetical protein F4679DRAFT_522252 [Xylaria curta]
MLLILGAIFCGLLYSRGYPYNTRQDAYASGFDMHASNYLACASSPNCSETSILDSDHLNMLIPSVTDLAGR